MTQTASIAAKAKSQQIVSSGNIFASHVVTVFCSASQFGEAKNPELIAESAELGRLLGENRIVTQTGGKSRSFMFAVSNGVTSSGGHLIGTTTQYLAFQREKVDADDVAMRIYADGMQSRKVILCTPKMIVQAPGGIGTLDEISDAAIMLSHGEALGVRQADLNYKQVLSVVRFGAEMHRVDDVMFRAAVDMGDISPKFLPIFHTVDSPMEVIEKFAELRGARSVQDLSWPHFDPTKIIEGMPAQVAMTYDLKHEGWLAKFKPCKADNKIKPPAPVTIAVWGGTREESLTPERMTAVSELIKTAQKMGVGVLHSGQKGTGVLGGLKQFISMSIADRGMPEIAIVAEPVTLRGYGTGLSKNAHILSCESAVDQAVKKVAKIIVLFGLSLDTFDKLTEFQTEVDTRESDMIVIAYNGDGSFDRYQELIKDRHERGFISKRVMENIAYPKTPKQLCVAVKMAVEMQRMAQPGQRIFSFAKDQTGEEGTIQILKAMGRVRG